MKKIWFAKKKRILAATLRSVGKVFRGAQRCTTGRKLAGIARSAASYNFCRLDFQPARRPDERGQTSGRAPTHPLQVSFARGSRGTTLRNGGGDLYQYPLTS